MICLMLQKMVFLHIKASEKYFSDQVSSCRFQLCLRSRSSSLPINLLIRLADLDLDSRADPATLPCAAPPPERPNLVLDCAAFISVILAHMSQAVYPMIVYLFDYTLLSPKLELVLLSPDHQIPRIKAACCF
jgi:hypothetical protein